VKTDPGIKGAGVVQHTYITWALLLILLIVAQSVGQPRPQWLYTPPQNPDLLFGVGVSPLFRTDSLTYRNARQNAIEEIVEQYRVQVISRRAERRCGGRSFSYEYTLELIDSVYYRQCYRNARALDSIRTEDYVYILMAVHGDLSLPDKDIVASGISSENRSDEIPGWVRQLPNRPGYLYGLGISPRYRNEDDSWDNSAKQARREIALTLRARRAYLQNDDVYNWGSFYQKWSEARTDFILEQSKIIARWYDAKRQLFYTLMEYPLSQ